MWDGIHDQQKTILRSLLLSLAAEKANHSGRAFWLSCIENLLGAHGDDNNDDDEHAVMVARFVTVLARLSEGAIRVLHEMTEGPITDDGIDNENAGLSALIDDMTDRPVTEVVFNCQSAGFWQT